MRTNGLTHTSDWTQFGSCALFGLYLVVKYLGKEWINWLLGWYFAIAGVGSCAKVRHGALICCAEPQRCILVDYFPRKMDNWYH